MATARLRVGAFGVVTMFAAMACGGGFAGASSDATTAPSAPAAPSAEATAAPSASAEPVTLTVNTPVNETIVVRAKALTDAYTAKHPNVTFDLTTRPDGQDGETILKTQLASGEVGDIFWYNSGSLLQALNPAQSMLPVTGEPWLADIQESYLPTVTVGGEVYGAPNEPAMGGGILYNKKIYADLGLEVPKTWDEFVANNEAIKAANIAPVGATFAGDSSWTSQILVLADYCNVEQATPGFAEKYTTNQAHYADTPAAAAGFQHLQDGFDKGWWQKDFGATSFDDGLNGLAEGKWAHYPMLTFALGTIAERYPAEIENIGFFGVPGTDAAKNCATIWMPAAYYIGKNTQHPEVAKDFLGFLSSVEGTEVLSEALAPSGPYVTKGSSLPDTVLSAVKDIQPYLDSGMSVPALEFLSPVKGALLPDITVAVGSGQESAAQGAKLADQDVAKQAQQLGLPGWE